MLKFLKIIDRLVPVNFALHKEANILIETPTTFFFRVRAAKVLLFSLFVLKYKHETETDDGASFRCSIKYLVLV